MKSYYAKQKEVERNWVLIDLQDKVLGRAATQIANILRGKTKPTYTPSVDTGDFVVAINAKNVKMTGRKTDDKFYHQMKNPIWEFHLNLLDLKALGIENNQPQVLRLIA